jgi:hypothetical protein
LGQQYKKKRSALNIEFPDAQEQNQIDQEKPQRIQPFDFFQGLWSKNKSDKGEYIDESMRY